MINEIRTCIISRDKWNKKEMIQITYHPSWNLIVNFDWWKSIKWRSIYLKNNTKNIEELKKRGIWFLNQKLKRIVKKETFDEIFRI